MMFHSDWFLGVHLLWWLLWLAVIVALVVVVAGLQRRTSNRRETPLERLQRRYAEGQMSSEEYEERRAKLERDVPMR
jgi:putative membrane protein